MSFTCGLIKVEATPGKKPGKEIELKLNLLSMPTITISMVKKLQ